MLQEQAPDVFIGEGPSVSFYGFPYPTRMVVVRLPDGNLWVWSPIELTDELASEIEALGTVRHIVSPNKLHHLFLGPWANKYQDARLYAPPGLSKKRKDLKFSAELRDEPEDEWKDVIDQVIFTGSFVFQEVMFFHKPSGTAIVGDLVQRMDKIGGLRGFILRLDGLVGEQGGTPRDWRMTFLRRKGARAAREKALAWKPERLIIAHGRCTNDDVVGVLTRALSWM